MRQKNCFTPWLCLIRKSLFICTGNELIYLDPHTTQVFVDSEDDGTVDDRSFHCQQAPHRMKIMNLDPSVALVGIKKRVTFQPYAQPSYPSDLYAVLWSLPFAHGGRTPPSHPQHSSGHTSTLFLD